MQDADPIVLTEIENLAQEITRYLQQHHGVADTLEGVTHWWILRQRLQEEQGKVQQAMDYLCVKGIVHVSELPDGEILYSAAGLDKNSHRFN